MARLLLAAPANRVFSSATTSSRSTAGGLPTSTLSVRRVMRGRGCRSRDAERWCDAWHLEATGPRAPAEGRLDARRKMDAGERRHRAGLVSGPHQVDVPVNRRRSHADQKRAMAVGVSLAASVLATPGFSIGCGHRQRSGRPHHDLPRVVRPRSTTPISARRVPQAADVIVFHDQLLQSGHAVGDEIGSCVLVDATGLSNCTGVMQLEDRGTITFAFVNAPPPHKVLAVTGGSGEFKTARGDGTLDENGDGTGTLVLRLIGGSPHAQ